MVIPPEVRELDAGAVLASRGDRMRDLAVVQVGRLGLVRRQVGEVAQVVEPAGAQPPARQVWRVIPSLWIPVAPVKRARVRAVPRVALPVTQVVGPQRELVGREVPVNRAAKGVRGLRVTQESLDQPPRAMTGSLKGLRRMSLD